MSELPVGELLRDLPIFQITLLRGHALLWRETISGAEAVIWRSGVMLPSGWRGSSYVWKVIGEESVLQELWRKIGVPQGSRPITVKGECRVRCDLAGKQLSWQGVRHKRVLIVDDSSTLRKLLRHLISSFGDWDVIGELPDAESVPRYLDENFPDLVTLDLHLGAVDGAEAMRRFLAPRRVPTILISAQPKEDGGLVMDALSAGAFDYLQKPESGQWEVVGLELKAKLDEGLKSRWQTAQGGLVTAWRPIDKHFPTMPSLIVIGSSTGGTQALQDVLLTLPREIPPILITQHIPAVFSRALAERLNSLCPFEVKEAADGDEVRPGRVLIAPGGHHMRLAPGGRHVIISDDEPINRFRPSVDALFDSVATNAKCPVTAAILTGMGRDGAQGLLNLKKAAAHTIAQDEKTSVVFGMPKAAIELGAALKIEPLGNISTALVEGVLLLQKRSRSSA